MRKAALFAVVVGVASLAGVAPVGAGKAGGITINFNPSADESTICLSIASAINFDWSGGGPGGDCPSDYFQARAQGGIIAPITGTVEFCGVHNDGMFLYVGREEIFRNMDPQDVMDPCNSTGTIALVEGQCYPLTMFYYEQTGLAALSLKWTWDSLEGYQVIPASAYVESCGADFTLDMSGFRLPTSQALPKTGRNLDAFWMLAASVIGLGAGLAVWARRRGALAPH